MTLKHRLSRRAAAAAAAGLALAVLFALLLLDAGPAAAATHEQLYPSPSPVTTSVTTPMPTTAVASPVVATATATTTPSGTTATIVLASNSLGTILTDGANGLTLYTFAADTAGSGTSACYGTCATNWPPLLSSSIPAQPSGLTAPLGLISRTDGTQQVTMGGMPLYLFKGDTAPGDTSGNGINAFGGVWSVALAAAATTPTPTASPTSTPTATPTTPAATGAATIVLAPNSTFGPILTDGANGLTLYTFAADTAGNGASACYGACATNWPPLLTSGVPARPAGLTGALGVITRTDGTQQVTLAGMPLYLFKFDTKPGDVKGQGINAFGGVWSVALASGAIPTSAAKPATTPVAPSTGSGVGSSSGSSVLGLSLAAALLVIVSGSAGLAFVRRRP
ncbi:MAG TPA: hypothetical protein VN697_13270 [Tepidiformaceae bacterium]|nr:hypothetical protein [Tepidiformaceae bacterium]